MAKYADHRPLERQVRMMARERLRVDLEMVRARMSLGDVVREHAVQTDRCTEMAY